MPLLEAAAPPVIEWSATCSPGRRRRGTESCARASTAVRLNRKARRMRMVRWLAVIALVLPAPAWADDHRADMNGGISGGKASKLFGIHVTFAMPIPDQEKWSVLADISHHWDLNDDLDEKRAVYLSGLRYTHPISEGSNQKIFGHGLLGSGHTTLNGSSDADLTVAFGG